MKSYIFIDEKFKSFVHAKTTINWLLKILNLTIIRQIVVRRTTLKSYHRMDTDILMDTGNLPRGFFIIE